MAIGVVTDRGTRLSTKLLPRWNHFAIKAVDRMAIHEPTATFKIISTAYFFKIGKYL